MRRLAPTLTLGIAAIAVAVIPLGSQPAGAQKPAFEAATIKPSKPDSILWAVCHGTNTSEGSGGWIASRILPGSQPPPRPALGRCLMTGVTLKMIVGMAYLAFPYKIDEEIAGGPNWAGSDRFDVETKAENVAATEEQLSEMLQQLLADRFRLTFHREAREASGYALVIAKSGTKLRSITDTEARTRVGGRPGLMTFQAVPLVVLADFLSASLGKRILDQTGLTGMYTFTLTWTENELVPAGTPPPGAPSSASDTSALIAAIQEQLGLRLESAKVPLPILVIDSVQKPSEN